MHVNRLPPEQLSLHELVIRVAECTHSLVAFAHGDESPFLRINPTRDFFMGGQRVPIGDRELIRRPAALLGFLVAFRLGLSELLNRPEGTIQLAPDGVSVHEGCGGKHGQNWHDVAMVIAMEVNRVADSIFPRDKQLIASRHTKEQIETFRAALTEEDRSGTCIVDFEHVDRFYDAIRRIISPFSFDQLEARMRAEHREELEPQAKRKPKKTDNATESRDKWIYEECVRGTKYETIVKRLQRKPRTWGRIDSKQGIRAAAERYAKRHNLPPIPMRQDL